MSDRAWVLVLISVAVLGIAGILLERVYSLELIAWPIIAVIVGIVGFFSGVALATPRREEY